MSTLATPTGTGTQPSRGPLTDLFTGGGRARRLALRSAERAGATAGPGPQTDGDDGVPPPTAPDGGQRVRTGVPGTPEDVQA